ncbi:MAG TPA: ECF transporter S component [Ruminococcaceae bacterium]|nr:ECF transporter S component [Oscillospiraceae bacterium]
MSNRKKIQKLTVLSVLAAITAIVAFVPLKTLGLEITFTMIPVAIGAILYGPSGGAVLGAVFGAVSFLQCLGYSHFGAALFAINPVFTFIVCVPTRILAGLLAGFIYKALKAGCKSDIPALLTASLAAPLLNTVFFMSSLVLFFYRTDYIQGFVSAMGAANPIMFILLFVGINGLVEIICGFAVAFPAAKAISKYLKI